MRARKEMRGRWECLPGELLAYIFDKLDFEAISAARGVCKHWRESTLLLTSFRASLHNLRTCRRGTSYELITSMASFISKASSLKKLYVHDYSALAKHLLGSCDWTTLSHSLVTLHANLDSRISKRVYSLLSGCHSLSELIIESKWLNIKNLSFQLVERLRKLYLYGPVAPEWLVSLPRLPHMEELHLLCDESHNSDMTDYTVTLTAPKLRKLHVNLCGGTLIVEAPLVTSMQLSGYARVHVDSAACQLEWMTLGLGTVLVRGPKCLKRLVIDKNELAEDFTWSNSSLMESLLSCRALPWITSLTIAPLSWCELEFKNRSMVDIFRKEVGRLVKLEELELSLSVINLLGGLGPLKDFLPALKTMVVNTYSPEWCPRVNDSWKTMGEAKHILEVLKGFSFPTHFRSLEGLQLSEGKHEV